VSEPTRSRYPNEEGSVVDDQGVQVFYEVYGESPDAVCMLPPWALVNSRMWRLQIPYLREFMESGRSGAVSSRELANY
jgi:hypothetical protein